MEQSQRETAPENGVTSVRGPNVRRESCPLWATLLLLATTPLHHIHRSLVAH